MTKNEFPYRYPGTRPFEEKDRDLFFGRNQDKTALSKLIVLEKLVVLFSKSGYGKSSLLNAGVIPFLRETENHKALTIRLNEQTRTPLEILLHHLATAAGQKTFLHQKFNLLEEMPQDLRAKLWFYAKNSQLLQQKPSHLLLVFDQFEELFNFSESEIQRFSAEIAALLSLNMPQTVREKMKEKLKADSHYFTEEETDQLLAPLHVKVVFSLRNDRLSLLDQLKTHLPAIFKKTYELQALNEAQALEAILEPADKVGNFASPCFAYQLPALELIVESLKESLSKNSHQKQGIEAFQLQLICQHIEGLIIAKQKAAPKAEPYEIAADEIGEPAAIFEKHYTSIIFALPEAFQEQVRILIEDKLIVDGNRVPLPKRLILKENKLDEALLKTLVDERLLRSEPNTVGGTSYELSHDTLVAPIQKAAQVRREQEAKIRAEAEEKAKQQAQRAKEEKEKAEREKKLKQQRKIILIVSIAAVVSLAFGVFGFWNMQKAEHNLKRAEKQTQVAKEQTQIAVEANDKAQKIIDAFYFYDGKLALAYKNGSYGFIDKQGNVKIYYQYEEAQPFDQNTGFAKVKKKDSYYLIDTTGTEFLLAEDISTLTNETEALDLSAKYLTQLPKYLFEHTQLKILKLTGNQLSSLPPEIGQLKNLTELDLGDNQLSTLPPEIGQLRNLTDLDLGGNQLNSLPPEIWQFKKLTKLYLYNSQLNTLPPEIGLLKNLIYLDLGYNKLSSLPPEIGQLKNLGGLYLGDNQLSSLSPEIGQLKKLRIFALNNNQLSSLPPEIGQLKNLILLDLQSNQLSSLPPEITQLKNLKEIYLGDDLFSESINEFSETEKKKIEGWLPNCEIEW